MRAPICRTSWCLFALVTLPLPAATTAPKIPEDLSRPYAEWLAEVAPLLLDEERAAFLSLRRDYQRELFVERFWEVRDPYPETGRNEFLETWSRRVELARQRFGGLEGDRARVLLLAGPPRHITSGLCPELLRSLEVWAYAGAPEPSGTFHLVFVARAGGAPDRYRLWEPHRGVDSLLRWSMPEALTQEQILGRIARECLGGSEAAATLERAADWRYLYRLEGLLPRPEPEWVDAFLARSTDLPAGARTLSGSLSLEFPGRHQSRTVVQGLITIPRSEAQAGSLGKRETFNFLVDGEVLRGERLFERFRYRFALPAEEGAGGPLPLAFQRYLRPADYTLIVKVQDINSGRSYRTERAIRVPALTAQGDAGGVAAAAEPESRPEVAERFREANAVLAAGDHTLKFLSPPEQLHVGRLRVEAVATGPNIAKVAFSLNGRRVMSKTRAPYSVELDVGRAPRLHTLEAVALDAEGRELARDRVPINAGPHRFAVRLLEPQPGRRYSTSLRANAQVDVPRGEVLDRLEFYLNETRLASLYQTPFVQPILVPDGGQLAYVRAVAYLADGNSTEDLVFINTPNPLERLQINFVELYTSVLDRRGRPIEDLTKEDFTVLEDGEEQRVARFERVRDLPIHAGIVLDTSTSMVEELEEAVRAALRFFESVVQAKDRAAVVAFNDAPELKVPFTNKVEVLAGGLAGLTAEGETALYDSLIYTLYYFSGIRGKRALILLTDGHDSSSRSSFDEALEFAQRSGVAIYSIGMKVPHREAQDRTRLWRLASETGGRAFFIERATELKRIYASIEEELRSQYLLGYQSSREGGGEFRRVEVRLRRPGLEAKTIPGYYP
ncbi:MAG: VWA domain-containing protein [Thermoanaerobaculia bacterium]